MTDSSRHLIFFGLFIFLTRVPFFFDGFGSEEDAWAMQLVTERIGTTGIYEVSRLPGHPVQELIYSLCWSLGPVFYNLLTAIFSTLGILAFIKMLIHLGLKNAYWCGIALAFTPIIYINSCNAMDYTWAMGFILMSGYFLTRKQIIIAAGMLSFAVGCRITSGAMLLPYLILLWNIYDETSRLKNIVIFTGTTLLGSLIVMSPVILQYGLDFFTYYDHFAIPGFLKSTYKGSIAVWGIFGCLAIAYYFIKILIQKRKPVVVNFENKNISKTLVTVSVSVILLYLIAFLKIPLKAAFIIPICPFLIIGFALFLNEKSFRNLAISFIFSSFFFGINLADENRGSATSSLAIHATIGENLIAIDPLQGLVLADQSKRRQQIEFAKKIIQRTSVLPKKTILIAGWWNAIVQVLQKNNPNHLLIIRHYIDESELKWLKESGFDIYYVADQGMYNDLRFQKEMTDQYAKKIDL